MTFIQASRGERARSSRLRAIRIKTQRNDAAVTKKNKKNSKHNDRKRLKNTASVRYSEKHFAPVLNFFFFFFFFFCSGGGAQ